MKQIEIKQEELLNYIRKGYSQTQIAKEKGVSRPTVKKEIQKIDPKLIEEAKQSAKQQKQHKKQEKDRALQERILEYIKQGCLQNEMAQREEVADSKISEEISKIDTKRVDEARKEARINLQEELLGYVRGGYIQEEIAEIKGVTQQTISQWMKAIDPKLIEEAKQYAKENKNEQSQQYTRIKGTIIRKMRLERITKEHVEKYQQAIDEQYDKVGLDDIALLIKGYIKTKQIQEALYFLNKTINNEDMEYLGIEQLNQLKIQIEQIQKKQKVRREMEEKEEDEFEEVI